MKISDIKSIYDIPKFFADHSFSDFTVIDGSTLHYFDKDLQLGLNVKFGENITKMYRAYLFVKNIPDGEAIISDYQIM
jgi:hypothetical protein